MKKIVVIEDDPYLLEFFLKRLQEKEYQVVKADHSSATLIMLQELSPAPDLVLIGQSFFGEQELNVLTYIKQSEKLAHIPVIVMMPVPTRELVLQALEMGASDVWIEGQVYEEGVAHKVGQFFEYPEDTWHHQATVGKLSPEQVLHISTELMNGIQKDKIAMQRYIDASKAFMKKEARKKTCQVCGFSMPINDESCPQCGNMTF